LHFKEKCRLTMRIHRIAAATGISPDLEVRFHGFGSSTWGMGGGGGGGRTHSSRLVARDRSEVFPLRSRTKIMEVRKPNKR
jgi:hypothetical protein